MVILGSNDDIRRHYALEQRAQSCDHSQNTPATVLIKDVVDALEMQFDEQLSFWDLDTGQVETVSRELLGVAEEGDEEETDLTKRDVQ
jgi:hypothetical protein